MLPIIASAAVELGKQAIASDAKTDQVLFANPASGGGIQSLGALTVGNRQVGGHGNAAGATTASPSVGPITPQANASGVIPDVLSAMNPTEKYALLAVGVLLVGAIVYKMTR